MYAEEVKPGINYQPHPDELHQDQAFTANQLVDAKGSEHHVNRERTHFHKFVVSRTQSCRSGIPAGIVLVHGELMETEFKAFYPTIVRHALRSVERAGQSAV